MHYQNLPKLLVAGVMACTLLGGFGMTAYAQSEPTEVVQAVVAEIPSEPGVLIVAVEPESPAAQAGLRRGDIILSVDEVTVNGSDELLTAVQSQQPGAQVTITVLHGDDEKEVEITLGDRAGQAYLGIMPFAAPNIATATRVMAPTVMAVPAPQSAPGIATTSAQMTTTAMLEIVGVDPESPAAEAGLAVGDLIVAVEGTPVAAEMDAKAWIAGHKPGDKVNLQIQSGAASRMSTTPPKLADISITLGENPNNKSAAYLGVQLRPIVTIQLAKTGVAEAVPATPHADTFHFAQPGFAPSPNFQMAVPAPAPMPMPPMVGFFMGYLWGAPQIAMPGGNFYSWSPAAPLRSQSFGWGIAAPEGGPHFFLNEESMPAMPVPPIRSDQQAEPYL